MDNLLRFLFFWGVVLTVGFVALSRLHDALGATFAPVAVIAGFFALKAFLASVWGVAA